MATLKVFMKALAYIYKEDLNSGLWQLELEPCESKASYGTYFNVNLPPHLSIWADPKNLPSELANSSPDYFLIQEDGEQVLFIWTIPN